MPDPITAPIPRAVSDQGPSVFCNRCPGASDSEISLSIDLQQKICLSEVRTTSFGGGSLVVGCDKRFVSPERRNEHKRSGWPTLCDFRRVGIPNAACSYRFAWPRANFLTFGFFDPRG